MTVTPTPAVAGAQARRRRLRRSGAIVAVMVAIGAAFALIPSIGSADGGAKCESESQAASQAQTALDDLDRTDYTSGGVGGAEFNAEKARLEAEKLKADRAQQQCRDDEEEDTPRDTIPATTVTTQPPSGDCYTTPVFSANGRTDHRFGDMPVQVSGPQDVGKVVQAKVDGYCTDPFQVAKDAQNDYLGSPGINTEEVQALANSYVADHAKWERDAKVLRARLGRATFELKRVGEHRYHTEDAIPSSDPSRAPAAKEVDSHGERWILVTHMSAKDGGKTIEEVVDCKFQKHVTIVDTPEVTVPKEETPTASTAPPATTAPPTTAPPVTAPPTTAPPVTTTQPVTTTTKPPAKGPEENPCKKYPTMPGCSGS